MTVTYREWKYTVSNPYDKTLDDKGLIGDEDGVGGPSTNGLSGLRSQNDETVEFGRKNFEASGHVTKAPTGALRMRFE